MLSLVQRPHPLQNLPASLSTPQMSSHNKFDGWIQTCAGRLEEQGDGSGAQRLPSSGISAPYLAPLLSFLRCRWSREGGAGSTGPTDPRGVTDKTQENGKEAAKQRQREAGGASHQTVLVEGCLPRLWVAAQRWRARRLCCRSRAPGRWAWGPTAREEGQRAH